MFGEAAGYVVLFTSAASGLVQDEKLSWQPAGAE